MRTNEIVSSRNDNQANHYKKSFEMVNTEYIKQMEQHMQVRQR